MKREFIYEALKELLKDTSGFLCINGSQWTEGDEQKQTSEIKMDFLIKHWNYY